MTNDVALGQMPNAPLALVLAQVRFSPYLTIGNSIPAIQDALRKNYPLFRKSQIQSLEITGAGAPNISSVDRWDFVDQDNREGFIVQQDSLTFLATRYKTFEDFAEKQYVVLSCFENTVKDVFVERLGLRYVDVIVPRGGEQPEQYVVDGLRGCSLEMYSPLQFRSQYVGRWNLDSGAMTLRFINGAPKPYLPPDLQPLELGIPEIIEKASTASGRVGTLDFDRALEHRGLYSASKISELFAGMHADASNVFKRAMSPLAKEVWNSKIG